MIIEVSPDQKTIVVTHEDKPSIFSARIPICHRATLHCKSLDSQDVTQMYSLVQNCSFEEIKLSDLSRWALEAIFSYLQLPGWQAKVTIERLEEKYHDALQTCILIIAKRKQKLSIHLNDASEAFMRKLVQELNKPDLQGHQISLSFPRDIQAKFLELTRAKQVASTILLPKKKLTATPQVSEEHSAEKESEEGAACRAEIKLRKEKQEVTHPPIQPQPLQKPPALGVHSEAAGICTPANKEAEIQQPPSCANNFPSVLPASSTPSSTQQGLSSFSSPEPTTMPVPAAATTAVVSEILPCEGSDSSLGALRFGFFENEGILKRQQELEALKKANEAHQAALEEKKEALRKRKANALEEEIKREEERRKKLAEDEQELRSLEDELNKETQQVNKTMNIS